MHFAAGNHHIWWDEKGHMRQKKRMDHEIWRVENLFPSALAVITSRLLANDPRWNPHRSGLENVSDDEIKAADAALRDVWNGDKNGDYSIKQALKLVVRHGYLQGGRLAYFRFDDKAKMPVMDTFPLWDVYKDDAQTLKDTRLLCIPVSKGVNWVKRQDNFTEVKNAVAADNKWAESGLQQQYLNMRRGSKSTTADTVLIYYCFEQQKDKIKFEIVCPQGVLYEDLLPYDTMSAIFDIYHPVEEEEFYARPPCMDWVGPNKSVNQMVSNIENYIMTFLQGKWVLRDRSKSVPFAGAQGQKMYGLPGDFSQLQLQPLPSTHFEHLANTRSAFERVSGVHSESLGRSPSGAESGVAIAQLQALDEQNSADPVDNFKMFLARGGKKLLRQMSDHWDEVRPLYRYDDREGEQQPMNVVGANFSEAYEDDDSVVAIRPFERLDVDIEIGAWFKESQKQKLIVDLLSTGHQFGANPVWDRVILSGMDIGIGREISEELKQLANPRVQVANGQADLIASGEQVEINNGDPHQLYWSVYKEKAEQKMEEGDEQAAMLLNRQAQQHAILMEQTGKGAGSPEAPETEEEFIDGQGEDIVPPEEPPQEELPL
jgi:hypothetical protein